jgi:ABC-type Mn2+/Zn2+ transport system permease subunit
MAWGLGALVSAAGLLSSFRFDLPTGAAVVVMFGIALLGGAVARAILSAVRRD